MKGPPAAPIVAAMLLVAGCDLPKESADVEYRPEEAGTVDHALCLLGFTAVPLRTAAGTGHHLVDIVLNGRPGLFVLDTGANVSVVEDDHAALFGLGEGATRGPGISLGGSVTARQAPVDSLRIDRVDIRQNRIAVADLGRLVHVLGPLAGGTVHGLIGQDVLNEHRAVIDMDRPLLYLIEADRDPAPIPAERCSESEGQEEEPKVDTDRN